MNTTRTLASLTLFLCLSAPTDLIAQVDDDQQRLDAALEDLANGRLEHPKYFIFHGCPQDDPEGREVFETVTRMTLDPSLIVWLAWAFQRGGTYPDCGYAPLNEWLARGFEELHRSGSAREAWEFAMNLGPLIDIGLQRALLDAAADDGFVRGRPARVIADAAIFYRPPERQVDEAIAAFRRDDLSGDWLTSTTYRLSRSFGPQFYQALATAAGDLSDGTLEVVANAIGTEVVDGRADPQAAGMQALRDALQRRPRLRDGVEIPERRPGNR